MRFPLVLHTSMVKYLWCMHRNGTDKFPLVLMLEPTHLCNLHCPGCGRIREYKDTLNEKLTVEQCLKAVDECGAPVVTITGGEPLLYDEVDVLVKEILARKKNIYFCTNGTLLSESLHMFKPDPRFSFNVHMDGPEEVHDEILGKQGIFAKALDGIIKAKEKGFRVTTNTTIYRETKISDIERLFRLLDNIGVDGLLVSPGFAYDSVTDQMFLTKEEIVSKFREIEKFSKRYKIISTPLYLEFLTGRREFKCTPWGNPTYNVLGWKSPCYLITDTHYKTFKELMVKTDWDKYVNKRDKRCKDCMVHCGFEPTAVREISKSWRDLWKMIVWNLHG